MWPGSTRKRSLSVSLYTHRNLSQMKRAHHGPGTAQRAEHALSLSCLTGVSGNGGMTDPYTIEPSLRSYMKVHSPGYRPCSALGLARRSRGREMIRGVILRYTTYTHNLSCSAHARLFFSVFFGTRQRSVLWLELRRLPQILCWFWLLDVRSINTELATYFPS